MNIPSCTLESHGSTSGKRLIWTRTESCLTRPEHSSDVRNDLIKYLDHHGQKGEGWMLAMASIIWPFIPSPSLSHRILFYVMRILLLYLGCMQTFVNWVFLGTGVRMSPASDKFQLLSIPVELGWGETSKQQANESWGYSKALGA